MRKRIILSILFAFILSSTFAQNLQVAKLDSLFHVLESKDKFMGSITITENGKLIYAKSIGKADVESNTRNTFETKYRIGSITKMFTASMILKAVEDKKLSLDQTIDRYFPAVDNAKRITIENLLTHRSGIHNITNDEEYMNYYLEAKSEKQLVEIISKSKNEFEPGSKFSYSNSNFILLSFILEKTYHKPYKKILEEKITKPMGLRNTYYGSAIDLHKNESNSYSMENTWVKEKETHMSIPMGAGAIVSNPSDLCKFAEDLFAYKIISKHSLDLMLTIKGSYGLGIRPVPFFEKTGYGHSGGIDAFTSALYYFPEEKLSVAITSNGAVFDTKSVLKAALSFYYGKDFDIPTFKTIELKPEELDQYAGEYINTDLPLEISFTKDNGKLIAQSPGQSAIPLEATDKHIFEFRNAGIKLEFKPAEKQVILYQGGQTFVLKKK